MRKNRLWFFIAAGILLVTTVAYRIIIKNYTLEMDIPLLIIFISGIVCYVYYFNVFRTNTILVGIVLLLGIFFVFCDASFSPIDEGAMFDYVNHIINEHRLPTYEDIDIISQYKANGEIMYQGTNYESVQGPVYFLIAAVLTFSMPVNIRFYFLRFVGVLTLIGAWWIAGKTYKMLQEANILKDEKKMGSKILALILLNPGALYRSARISNESLTILLSFVVMYVATYMIVMGINMRLCIGSSVLCGLTFLTKNTSAFWIGSILLVTIYYKDIKKFIVSILSWGITCCGWFGFNLYHYGSMTSMKQHLGHVLQIVNPNHNAINLIEGFPRIFLGWLLPQEISGNGNSWFVCFNYMFQFLMAALIIVSCKNTICFLVKCKLRFQYDTVEKQRILYAIATIIISAAFTMFCISTATSYVDAFLGRYFYTMAGLFTYVAVIELEDANYKKNFVECGMGGAFVTAYVVAGFSQMQLVNENGLCNPFQSYNAESVEEQITSCEYSVDIAGSCTVVAKDECGGFLLRGWGIKKGVDSSDTIITIALWNDKKKLGYIYKTRKDIRTDVTASFDDGINYDESGYTAYIDMSMLPEGEYRWVVQVRLGEECYNYDSGVIAD